MRGTGNGERETGGGRESATPIPRLPSSVLLLSLALACTAPTTTGDPVRVTIPPGASFRVVTDSVSAHGLVGSRFWFRTLARIRGVDRRVQAGVYDIPAGASASQVLSLLEEGRIATTRFTAPEGLTLLELGDLVEARLGIPADSFVLAARDPERLRALEVPAQTLEGYLLPETYTLPLPVTAAGLVDAMVAEFARRWQPAWDARLDSIGLTRHQLLALAAIVEGEARHDEERATIAGVYSNRLRIGMPLQADPTVQYAIQLATGARKPRLLFKDLEIASPYNTYRVPGLPPGPVNSPGVESIEAALYPADVPWLYFVAIGDGYHRFSRTLVEHNRAITEARRLRNSR
ncbi:MAG: endolytic transglycosylase MltG [Gemmatimonadota bacterium]|nr:endolytic transglycosylase MltG [Gemmatimonadota bacterium]